MKYSNLYLSTLTPSGQYKPLDKTNLSNVSFNINWREIFRSEDSGKPMIIKIKMNSQNVAAANAPWDSTIGTVRCNLPSFNFNGNNSLVLALLNIVDNPTTGTGQHVIDVDTTQTRGVLSYVPLGTSVLNIQFYGLDETLLSNGKIDDYGIYFEFEILENI